MVPAEKLYGLTAYKATGTDLAIRGEFGQAASGDFLSMNSRMLESR